MREKRDGIMRGKRDGMIKGIIIAREEGESCERSSNWILRKISELLRMPKLAGATPPRSHTELCQKAQHSGQLDQHSPHSLLLL